METAEAADEKGAVQERERDLAEESGGGSEEPDAEGETDSTDEEKGEGEVVTEEERLGPSVVETAAPTDAVKPDHDPTVHHPLVRADSSSLVPLCGLL